MRKINYFLIIVLNFSVLQVFGAPPLDLSGEEMQPLPQQGALVPQKKAKAVVVNENDLIFGDPYADKAELGKPGVFKLAVNVGARGVASPRAKIIFKIRAGEILKKFQISKNKRYVAIELISSGRKAWIPVEAVVASEKKTPTPNPTSVSP